ncbi:tRNA (adenosine(37)-N6)-threonylcarbamoyltransferase complex ATPase subunit type 1 TsaE [candidate division TM6 bacterium RIFCSPHIGHO2_12_FULL_32_22]|nr:MAG: tRNA (adenosine(37)-N6)-threonylcarbamoyltransferase complex ATPase subunit type 1 TsaE [candidate division TM6 bacterium RIFCSPHIGHO2_12_FULL_32_22]
MKEYIYNLEEIPALINKLKNDIKDCKILALTGPLGAGKTTLIRELLFSMGVEKSEIISPTFNYVNLYRVNGDIIYHFDLYRINSLNEFLEAGFDEYLNSGSLVLIEWPEVIAPLLQNRACFLNIDYEGTNKRKLSLSQGVD